MENDRFLCSDCAKDEYLKRYVTKEAKSKNTCEICQVKKKSLNISNDAKIRNFCAFLIRYHFAEQDYNTHWGGEYPPHQFYSENPIISHSFANFEGRELEIEEFLYELFELNSDKTNELIFAGHDNDGMRHLYPEPLSEEKSKTWYRYKGELQKRNYFLLEDEAKFELKYLLASLESTIRKGTSFFRARIGYKTEEKEVDTFPVRVKVPYEGKEISSPPPQKTKGGRANRHGVSYLYLASKIETALGEVRPHPGHYVSIANFENTVSLRFVDLRFVDLMKYYDDPKKLEAFRILNDLSNELSIPVLPEEQENYLVTQFISDVVRQLNYDGIIYKSSVSEGYNLVVFTPETCSYQKSSSELFKISSLSFNYKRIGYNIDGFLGVAKEKEGIIQKKTHRSAKDKKGLSVSKKKAKK